MTGLQEKEEFDYFKNREPEPSFKVGQVVILRRSGNKRDLAAKILEIVSEGGEEFYRIDKKNCVSKSMIRWLTSDEMGW